MKGEKNEQINKGKTYDKICYLGGTQGYIFPLSVLYLLGGENIISEGGEEYDFFGKYIPLELFLERWGELPGGLFGALDPFDRQRIDKVLILLDIHSL